MNVDFRELHMARLRNHPPTLREVTFAPGVCVRYYDHPGEAIGSVLWPGGVTLARHLLSHSEIVTGKRVIELGSGLGVTGIVASKFAEIVHLTDKCELLQLLRQNLAANDCRNGHAFAYSWGDAVAVGMTSTYDVIICAEVLYLVEGYPGLRTAFHSLSKPGTRVLLTYKDRNLGEAQFLAEIQREVNDFHTEKDGEIEIVSFTMR